jgi:hypothetical protein
VILKTRGPKSANTTYAWGISTLISIINIIYKKNLKITYINLSNTTGTASGAESRILPLHMNSIGILLLNHLFSVLCFVDQCLSFYIFRLVIVLSFPRFTASDYLFDIIKFYYKKNPGIYVEKLIVKDL